jgi:hypothetical protein
VQVFKRRVKPYIPDFKLAFEHVCIHTGGRGVVEEIEKQLGMTPELMQPSKDTLFRYGNTSSSSIWCVPFPFRFFLQGISALLFIPLDHKGAGRCPAACGVQCSALQGSGQACVNETHPLEASACHVGLFCCCPSWLCAALGRWQRLGAGRMCVVVSHPWKLPQLGEGCMVAPRAQVCAGEH